MPTKRISSDYPFASAASAAPSADDLLEYLSATQLPGTIYRGQTRAFPGPLLPSGYRGLLSSFPVVDASDPTAPASLRGVGRRFIGNLPWDMEDRLKDLYDAVTGGPRPTPPSPEATRSARDAVAYAAFKGLSSQRPVHQRHRCETPLAEAIASVAFLPTFTQRGPDIAVKDYIHRFLPGISATALEMVRREIHDALRTHICADLLINALGFPLGSAISQHYGLSSEFLDFSSDPHIATFFATHPPPDYSFSAGLAATGIPGVVYVAEPHSPEAEERHDFDFLGAPPAFSPLPLLQSLESQVSPEQSLRSVLACHELRTSPPGARRYDLLTFPRGFAAQTRLAKQAAVMLVPDEVRVSMASPYYNHPVTGLVHSDLNRVVLCQKSIEDVATRPGLRAYYFRHSAQDPTPHIRACDLWPNAGDPLLLLIVALIASRQSTFQCPASLIPADPFLVEAGNGEIDSEQLIRNASILLSSIGPQDVTFFVADQFSTTGGKAMYFYYKAAATLFRACSLREERLLPLALDLCRQSRSLGEVRFPVFLLEALVLAQMAQAEPARLCISAGRSTSVLGSQADGLYSLLTDWLPEPDFAFRAFQLYVTCASEDRQTIE